MRRLVVLGIAFLVWVPLQASAYTDLRFDPNEPDGRYTSTVDIRSSRRTLLRTEGESRLILRVDAYGPLRMGDWWEARVLLDTRRGRHADFVLHMWNGDMTGNGCWVELRGSTEPGTEGKFRQGKHWAKCRVSASSIDRDKRIRWRIHIANKSVPEAIYDRAPDHGWYP